MPDITNDQVTAAYNDAHFGGRVDDVTDFRQTNLKIYFEVLNERFRQNLKFTGDILGDQHHNIITWAGILNEESGEVTKEALDAIFTGKSLDEARKEAIQTAAVAFAVIKAIDDNDVALLAPEVTQALV